MLPHVPQDAKDIPTLIKEVELLVIEMEGCLTDGGAVIDAQGDESITTCRADALGLTTWLENGGKLVVTAREKLIAAKAWCELYGFTYRKHRGVKNTMLNAVIFEHRLAPAQVCYLGSDLDDLPAMMIAGLSVATSQSPAWVRDAAHLVLETPAGRGAVRELVDSLLEYKKPAAD